MLSVPAGVRVWLASGPTDMRRGMNSLALQVQQVLKLNPHGGDLFVFRGKRGHLLKGSVGRWHWRVAVHQAAGARPLHLANASRRRGADQRCAAGLPARRHRLAPAAIHVAPAGGGLMRQDDSVIK
jgi:transposase